MNTFIIRLVRAAILCVTFGFSSSAMASYVNADGVNCRVSPSPTARIVTKLSRGREVSVMEGGGGWSHISSPSCWVSSKFLSEGYVAQAANSSSTGYNTVRSGSAKSYRRQPSPNLYSFGSSPPKKARKSSHSAKSRRSSSSGIYSGGSCPCSGGSVCIGPRGGRYCITSGGNKRYGV